MAAGKNIFKARLAAILAGILCISQGFAVYAKQEENIAIEAMEEIAIEQDAALVKEAEEISDTSSAALAEEPADLVDLEDTAIIAPAAETEETAGTEAPASQTESPEDKTEAPEMETEAPVTEAAETENSEPADLPDLVSDDGYAAKSVLTVRYFTDNGQAFAPFTAEYDTGASYYVTSPNLEGYEATQSAVSGVITEDTVVDVYYIPRTYTLTIRYLFADGSKAAEEYSGSYLYGEAYSFDAPEIDGYTPSQDSIEGDMPSRDAEVSVIYIGEDAAIISFEGEAYEQQQVVTPAPAADGGQGAGQAAAAQAQGPQTSDAAQTEDQATESEQNDQTIEIEDYSTPLGLGGLTVNAGDCVE